MALLEAACGTPREVRPRFDLIREGDALGLTPINFNRVLRRLRLDGVMTLGGGAPVIEDITRLAVIAGFDDSYLHRCLRRPA
jgi:hypothetical protein